MQPICFNSKILVNGSVITWKSASNLFVQSFYDVNGQIAVWSSFKQINGKNETFFFKWRQLVDAIPREWKRILGRDRDAGAVLNVIPEPHLQVVSRRLNLAKLNGKEIYIILINKIWEKPTSEEKIEREIGESQLTWSKIYMLGRRITLDSYSRQFHFKVTHNVLFLNKALNRMNIVESSLCSYCNDEDETTVHLFSGCLFVRGLWGEVQNFFRSKIILADLNPQSAILGWYQEKVLCTIKNQILLIFKMSVYKDRETGNCSLGRVLNKIKMVRAIEYGINTNNEYNRNKWEPIEDLLI